MFQNRNYTDPPAATLPKAASNNSASDSDGGGGGGGKAKTSKIIINREVGSNHIDTTKTGGPNKLGLGSKVVPVVSKSPINKTNMATGKPITPVKAATTSRVVKSAGSSHQQVKATSGMTRSNSASCERNDNKRNETIEKKKREEKLRLKLEKEAKKVGNVYVFLKINFLNDRKVCNKFNTEKTLNFSFTFEYSYLPKALL